MIPLQCREFSTLGLCHGSSQDGNTGLESVQSHTGRWQSIPLDFPARDPLAEGFSGCSSILGGTESPRSPGLAVPTCLGVSGRVRGSLAALCGGGRSHPAQRAGPAAGSCSSSCLTALWCPWWPGMRGECDPPQWRQPQALGTEELWVTNFACPGQFDASLSALRDRGQRLLGTRGMG